MNEIGIFSFGRKPSRRCPSKMRRRFGDTTLTDIALAKLAALSRRGHAVFFAGYEREFPATCEQHHVPFVRRDRESVLIDRPILDILSFLRTVDYFVRMDGQAINFDPGEKTINTKTVTPVYEFGHALYFFRRQYFLEHGTYWDCRTVRLIELPDRHELVDVDSEDDFLFAEDLWNVRRRRP